MIDDLKIIEKLCKDMRLDIIELAYRCDGPAHIGGALSIVECLAILYGMVMKHNPKDPLQKDRDRFILSKGHGVLAFYSVLHQTGYFSRETLLTFKNEGSALIAHPVMNMNLGIESSNGSLGHGLSMSVGIGWGLKKRGSKSKIFTLLGDGECDEGSVWEAAMSASRLEIDNLTAIVDCNGFQSDGPIRNDSNCLIMESKWKAQGWDTRIVDGHSLEALFTAVTQPNQIKTARRPRVIIASTIKGCGVSFMQGDNSWHHNRLTQITYDKARAELRNE